MSGALILSSIFACLSGAVVGWENVALSSTCKASSAFSDHTCHMATDGLLWYSKDWAAPNDGHGIWIQITFRQEYEVTYGRVMQRFSQNEQSLKIKLTFDGNKTLEENLTKRRGGGWTSYRGQHWDEFSIDHIRTRSVRIEVLDVYSTANNGFNELEFYTGINPCKLHYTFLDGRCYRYTVYGHLPWADARQLCQYEGGDLVNIGSEAERQTVLKWLYRGFHFDTNLWVSNTDLTFSNTTVEEGPHGHRSIHDIVNRTCLTKPRGDLAYESSDSPLLYICEAPPSFTEWHYVAPDIDDIDTGDVVSPAIPRPAALKEKPEMSSNSAMVGGFAFCAFTIVALVAIIAFGGYRYRQQNRQSGLNSFGSDNTLCSHV